MNSDAPSPNPPRKVAAKAAAVSAMVLKLIPRDFCACITIGSAIAATLELIILFLSIYFNIPKVGDYEGLMTLQDRMRSAVAARVARGGGA